MNPGNLAVLRDFESRLFDHLSTAPDIKLKIAECLLERYLGKITAFPKSQYSRKAALFLDFLRIDFQKPERISSQARYDHFDTSPYSGCGGYPLQPYYYNKNLPERQPSRRVLRKFSYLPASRMDSTAFWTWRRFSASVKISSAWSSKTALEISSPRWAGRQ